MRRSICLTKVASKRLATSGSDESSSAARLMILSSMSVMLDTAVTSRPVHRR